MINKNMTIYPTVTLIESQKPNFKFAKMFRDFCGLYFEDFRGSRVERAAPLNILCMRYNLAEKMG